MQYISIDWKVFKANLELKSVGIGFPAILTTGFTHFKDMFFGRKSTLFRGRGSNRSI